MTVDVVCADPVFLDLTFAGLTALPAAGAEHFARELHESPGGAAITAIGLARLGLRVAATAPLGRDHAGRALRGLLEAEGVVCAGPEAERTPLTVVVPLDGERALLSWAPPPAVDGAAIARLAPRAVVVNAERLAALPDGPAAYAVLGHPEAERLAGAAPDLGRATALIANRAEAERVTGQQGAEAAARALAGRVRTAVVSCGAAGAVAASGGELVHATAPSVEARDTTGAGDLLVAAYVRGDLAGLPLPERLRQAVVYASLSVRTATAVAGAATSAELDAALSSS